MAILKYTTEIDAKKTVGEIMGMLGRAGASEITMMLDAGTPTGIRFAIDTAHGPRTFRLPANIDAVWQVLTEQQRAGIIQPRYATREQAARVGWRIVHAWISAQLAIIETGMVSLDEVMLPYMTNATGATVVEVYHETGGWFLAPPGPLQLPPRREDRQP